nr:TetR/AcrR family transcriptional regulator [Rhabdothermincola salaria]
MSQESPGPGRPRRYDNSRRAAAARDTRQRVVVAAASLFSERGFASTSVRMIAERSGVSAETIYAGFGSKAAILQAWIDVAAAGDDEEIALRDRAEMRAAVAEEDPIEKIRIHLATVRRINERVAVPMRVLRAAALGDPELDAVLDENEHRRRTDVQDALDDVTAATPLRDDLDRDVAVDLVLVLTSSETYHALVVESGWTPERYEAEMVGLLCHSAWGPSGPRPRSRPPTAT